MEEQELGPNFKGIKGSQARTWVRPGLWLQQQTLLFGLSLSFFAALTFYGLGGSVQAQAQTQAPAATSERPLLSSQGGLGLLRRITVFPVMAPASLSGPAEEAWWAIREVLTEDKRFLVSSRSFLQQKDVLQPRAELSPADALILGRYLDAQGLITLELRDRELIFRAYEGEFGRLLWQHSMTLQASLPLAEQLVAASQRLMRGFISAIPYQGYVVVDALKGEALFSEQGMQAFYAEVGTAAQVDQGDSVQLLRLRLQNLEPLFEGGARAEIFAEGRVLSHEKGVLKVELTRMAEGSGEVTAETLLRVPRELSRLQQQYALRESLGALVDPTYLAPEMSRKRQQEEEKKPLVTSLSFILGLAFLFLF